MGGPPFSALAQVTRPSWTWRQAPYVSRVCAGRGSVTALGLRVGRACPRSAGVPADSGLRAQSGSCPGPRPAHRPPPGAPPRTAP